MHCGLAGRQHAFQALHKAHAMPAEELIQDTDVLREPNSQADLDEEAREVAHLVRGVGLRERPPHARKRPVLCHLVHV